MNACSAATPHITARFAPKPGRRGLAFGTLLAAAGCMAGPHYADTFAGVVGASLAPDGAVIPGPAPDALADGAVPDAGVGAALLFGDPGAAETRSPIAPPAAPSTDAVPAAGGPCNLSGRWILTEHALVQGLGVRQSPRRWRYFELAQRGSELTVIRGLHCGSTTVPIDPLGESAELRAAWPALTARLRDAGRKGRVLVSGAGCAVQFDKRYEALGMSR